MDISTEKTYNLLSNTFSLNNLLGETLNKSIQLGNKTITFVPHEENDYFYLGSFIEQDNINGLDIYNEMTIRIWKNKKVEVYSLHLSDIGLHEDIYREKHGIEYARHQIKYEATLFFIEWLTNLKNEHGVLLLQ